MTEKEVKEELSKVKHKDRTIDFDMMATVAHHLMGDISRDKPDLCHIYNETDKFWIGSWITGYGFFNILFPKESTRELTEEEIEYWESRYVSLAGGSAIPIKITRKPK